MKRPKSKFSSKLPKYQDGSSLPDFGTASPLDKAKGVGAALDVVTSLVPTKTFKGVSGIGDISATAADKYNKQIDKINKTRTGVSTGLNQLGSAAMLIPGVGTIAGLGLKGLALASKFIPFGKDKEEKAQDEFQKSITLDKISSSATAGAQARAATPKFQAPAYGKKGMKLKYKTKY